MLCSDNKGYTRPIIIMLSIIAFLIILILYKIIPLYYYYFEIKNQMITLSKDAAIKTDLEIKEKLHEQIKYLQIPATKDDIAIQRSGAKIKITIKYKEVIYFTINNKDYDLFVLNFSPTVKNEI
ncbi:MAG: DUF4845 domain-containing protein [Bdellovibrionota bacterium]|nr:DUF4845 domain-containing protein [Pseudomonadota bacterium]MDY6091369.1 DUF4845 domain-containing protein [Bdellovibrionota bacterium]